jgi:hypothetical protein
MGFEFEKKGRAGLSITLSINIGRISLKSSSSKLAKSEEEVWLVVEQ